MPEDARGFLETGQVIDEETYHQRRKQTKYLVGYDDFEAVVADQIRDNSTNLQQLCLNFKELQKEIFDYKRYIELQQTNRDMKFEQEVRNCLNEQLTYINELQTEMFKEVEHIRKQGRDVTWQVAKLEADVEELNQKKSPPKKIPK